MIPKVIHYCWFGRNKKTSTVRKCIASWKKYCPEYTIVEWNEDNFNPFQNEYTRFCYETQKWAYLSDYARLVVVEEQGGIYFDTDVEVIRPFDDLLNYDAFFGFETNTMIATGLGFGSIAHHPVMVQMLREYDELLDGKHGTIVCTKLNTLAIKNMGFLADGTMQIKNNVILLPATCLNPMDSATGVITLKPDTYSIHRYTMSADSPAKRARTRVTRVFHRLFGVECFLWLKKLLK